MAQQDIELELIENPESSVLGAFGETQDELVKTFAANQRKQQLLYNLAPYIPFIFNPANGILIAALAFSIATIIAAVAPPLLTAAAPALLSIAAGGLIFSAVTIIPFTIWEAIKHYNEWRLEMKEKHPDTVEHDEILGETKIIHNPNGPTYDRYKSTLLFAKSAKQHNLIDFDDKPKKNAYPTLTGFADSQLGQWVQAHYWQATIVGLGILFFALAIGACVGFFLGNPICFDLLHPIFALFQSFFAIGISGLHLPFLAIFTDPFVIDVITAVFITAAPLIIADNLRRMMDAREFYSPPPSSANAAETELSQVITHNENQENEKSYFLFNELKHNADTKTWNYLVSVFDKSDHTKELTKQDFTGLDDYEGLDLDTGIKGQPSQN